MEDLRTDAEKIADLDKATAAESKAAAAKPEPNIAYVGKREDAPAKLMDGRTTFDLPADQSQPFYHADAARITRMFPRLYKRFVRKGE